MALALDLHPPLLDAAFALRSHGGLRRAAPAAATSTWESERELLDIVRALAHCYPESLRARQLAEAPRVASHLHALREAGTSIADLGGGLGLFAPSCAAIGMRVWLVDDFAERRADTDALRLHQTLGVEVVRTPLLRWSERFSDESLDIVTCFDGLTRWHHSPRPVFAEAYRVLKPGGTLLIGAANAVSLRKRLAVPLGRAGGSSFEDWFYPEQFRARVREPVLADVIRLVRELGFEKRSVWGRDWQGHERSGWRRTPSRLLGRALRPFPTLCSDLYVLARKAD